MDYERLNSVYCPATLALGLGALGALAVGWLQPAPWLLALLLVAILNVVWLVAVDRWLRIRDQMLADETASYGPDPGGNEH